MKKGDENDGVGERCDPDRPAAKENARYRAEDRSGEEEEDHGKMPLKNAAVRRVTVAAVQLLGKTDAELTDVVGGERCGHRHALGVAERVVLHGGDKVDGHLKDLHRRRCRQRAEHGDEYDLDRDEDRFPADMEAVLHIVGNELGNERAERVGGDRDNIVQGACPAPRAERDAEKHDVAGLRVAENAAAEHVSIRAEDTGGEDECVVHPCPLAGKIKGFLFHKSLLLRPIRAQFVERRKLRLLYHGNTGTGSAFSVIRKVPGRSRGRNRLYDCTVNGQTVPVMTSVAVPGVTVNVPSVFCVNEAAGTVICPASVVKTPVAAL